MLEEAGGGSDGRALKTFPARKICYCLAALDNERY